MDEARETPAPERRSQMDGLRPVAAALLIYGAYRWTVDLVRLPDATPWPLLAAAFLVTAAGSIALPVAVIAAMARSVKGLGMALAAAVGGCVLVLAGAGVGRLLTGDAGGALAGTFQDAGKVVLASAAGLALAGAIREPNILLPAGIFAAFADFVVVNFGTVKHALSTPKGQALIQAVSAKAPSVHPALGTGLTIGPADFLFLGLFLACAQRFEMGLAKNAWVLAAVLALSLALVPLLHAIPALAPMSAAFVLLNWRRFRLTREEVVGSVLVLAVIGGLFAAYFLFLYQRAR